MAATYGRLTGKTGVCMSTLGPGATNLVTAAAYAQLGAMPMLMITGQKPIKSSKQGRFQVVDIVEMMKPLTKYTRQIVSAENVPARLREAIRLAEEERPGAVHLELPEDIERELTDEQPIPASAVRRPTAEKKSIERAVAMIEAARHPLLVIGAAANRQRTAERVRKIAFKYDIPFISTQMGKGVIDERSPRSLGTAALSNYDFLHRAIEHADLIVNIGHDVVEKPPFLMKRGGFEVIHVNFFTAAVDAVYFPQLEVVGDIATSVELISEQLSRQAHWDFSFFDKVRGAVESHVYEGTEDNRFPIYPQRLVADVRKVMPSDGVIALDNGVYKIWFARNYKAHEPNTVLLDNALATMGAGLPSAIAARLVCPERRVMAICGDGGFMMNSQELETAVGPLIRHRETDRVEQWVNEAVEQGAKVVCGGQRLSASLFECTVLADPAPESKVSKLEIFGPVICVYPYRDFDEAIARANDVPLAFQAAVFTHDIDTALRAYSRLSASAVMVNDHTAFRVDWMPFAGLQESGLAVGGIRFTMRDMQTDKMLVVRSGELWSLGPFSLFEAHRGV